jgi:hypothetical protein
MFQENSFLQFQHTKKLAGQDSNTQISNTRCWLKLAAQVSSTIKHYKLEAEVNTGN